jgi:flagellar biosynthesis protein FlhG
MKAYLDIAALGQPRPAAADAASASAAPTPAPVIAPRQPVASVPTAPAASTGPVAAAPSLFAQLSSLAADSRDTAPPDRPTAAPGASAPPARAARDTLWNDLSAPPRGPAVPDQADGLRRLFAHAAPHCMALVANPHVAWSGLALEALARAGQALGRQVLLVDAADTSPPAPEAAAIGLEGCIDRLPGGALYLAARGLPRRVVDTRGSAAQLLDDLVTACPSAELVIVHAEASDLPRLFKGRPLRPLLLAADAVDSVTHAYAGWKLVAQRCGWLTADLMLLASASSPRRDAIARSLGGTADRYFGGLLVGTAFLDPTQAPGTPGPDTDALWALLAEQLQPVSGSWGVAGQGALPAESSPGLWA